MRMMSMRFITENSGRLQHLLTAANGTDDTIIAETNIQPE